MIKNSFFTKTIAGTGSRSSMKFTVLFLFLSLCCLTSLVSSASQSHHHKKFHTSNHHHQISSKNHHHRWKEPLEDIEIQSRDSFEDNDNDQDDLEKSNSNKRNYLKKQIVDDDLLDNNTENDDENDDDEDEYDEPRGRHSYVMVKKKKDRERTAAEAMDEDEVLTAAFEKHMDSEHEKNPHDVYSYKLPSDLWFIVRYAKDPDTGHVEKYMNIVESFTGYLDKLDNEVKSVSVNVKGVETIFKITTKE